MSECRSTQPSPSHERPQFGALLTSGRRWCAALLAVALVPVAASGQPASDQREVEVHAYTLEHQPASEALVLVRRLLSEEGTVELQPRDNTVVVRDSRAVLDRLTPLLDAFDHPPLDLRFDIHLLRAGGTEGTAPPAAVVEKLERYLRYDAYRVLGSAGVTSREGGRVTYDLGDEYQVSFRLGTVIAGSSLKLHDFRISHRPPRLLATSANKSRQPQPEQLIQTNLNLWREKQFIMVLSQADAAAGDADDELMIAITFRPDPASEGPRSAPRPE